MAESVQQNPPVDYPALMERCGVYQAYFKFADSALKRIAGGEKAFEPEGYEVLARIRNAETKFYAAATGQKLKKREFPPIPPEMREELDTHLKERDPLAFTLAEFGYQIVFGKESSKGIAFDILQEALSEKLGEIAHTKEKALQIAQQVTSKLEKHIGSEDFKRFNTRLSQIPLLDDENTLAHMSATEIVDQLAYELMAAKGGSKTADDVRALVSLAKDVPSIRKDSEIPLQNYHTKPAAGQQSDSYWQNKVGSSKNNRTAQGLLGTALLVGPQLLPEIDEKKEGRSKATVAFLKGARTALVFTGIVVGGYLLQSAFMGNHSNRAR